MLRGGGEHLRSKRNYARAWRCRSIVLFVTMQLRFKRGNGIGRPGGLIVELVDFDRMTYAALFGRRPDSGPLLFTFYRKQQVLVARDSNKSDGEQIVRKNLGRLASSIASLAI